MVGKCSAIDRRQIELFRPHGNQSKRRRRVLIVNLTPKSYIRVNARRYKLRRSTRYIHVCGNQGMDFENIVPQKSTNYFHLILYEG